MGSSAAFIPVSSLIQQTTLKSAYVSSSTVYAASDIKPRVLLASIKNRGRCPCPRCLIPMNRIQNMGMTRDRQQRITLKRVDDDSRRFNIANARRLIYELNYAVDSKSLSDFLTAESWVPTSVSHTRFLRWSELRLMFIQECLFE